MRSVEDNTALAVSEQWNTRTTTDAGERAEGWQPIETAPFDDTLFLACTNDGRMMIYRGYILKTALADNTPKHLQFPATHWMPLPAAPPIDAERASGGAE